MKKAKPTKEPKLPNVEAARKIAASKRAAKPPARLDSKFAPKRSSGSEAAFLDGLRDSYSVSHSARAAGIDPTTAYEWKNISLASKQEDGSYIDDFCLRWVEAYEEGVDKIEDEITRRAVRGYEKPVYQGGILVGSVTEYSDTLAALVARGKRPGVYNTDRVEHTGRDGGPINHSIALEFIEPEKVKK